MFDGDEMNIAFLVNTQNIETAKICCTIDFRMTNLNDNSIILEPNHDTPYGMYIFTKYLLTKDLSQKDVLFLMQRTQIDDEFPIQKTYKGKDIIQYILGQKMQKYMKTLPLTNKILKQMFLEYYYIFGPIKTKQFIQNIQCFAFAVVVYYATTLTLDDCRSTYDFDNMCQDFKQLEQKLQQTVINKYLTSSNEDVYQFQSDEVIQTSMNFISQREPDIFATFSIDNAYANMIRSGSKGKVNLMTSLQHLGIQMEGSKLFNKGDHNRHSAYHSNRIGLRENNCIFDGLYNGLSSQSDYISINQFARLGFVTQKVKTAKPGYLNRRIDQFCSTVSISYHNTMLINNQLLLSTVFSGNGFDIKYQRRQNISLLTKNNEEIMSLFKDTKYVDHIIYLRDKMRKSMIYSQSIYKLQTQFYHPIDYDYIIFNNQRKTDKTDKPINIRVYHNMIDQLLKDLTVIQHDAKSNPEFQVLDEGYKMILELFIFNGLPFKKLVEMKVTINQLVNIYIEIVDQYEKYRINPGEYVGLQCSQAFCKDVTQKSIDVFHKVSAEKEQYQVDQLNQLEKYITKGDNITPFFIVRFRKEYSKDLQKVEQFKNLILKKVLRDYVKDYRIGFDKFPKSKRLGTLNDYHLDDILKVSVAQQQINFLNKIDIDDFYQKYITFIEINFDERKMREHQVDINQIQYGICQYLKNNIHEKNISQIIMQSNIYCMYNKALDKIQIRFFSQEIVSTNILTTISNLVTFIINDININYQFQDSQINQIFVEKKDYYEIAQDGSIQKDFEYTLTILSEVKTFYFLQNYKCIDYNRCSYNDIRNLEDYISIVILQKTLYQLIQESSIALIGDGQLPQNIQIICQIMCHNKYIIPFTRSAIKNVYGSDALYTAFFETQFASLVDGAVHERKGTTMNNYTSYFLTSSVKIGPQKTQIMVLNRKEAVLSKKVVKIQIPIYYHNVKDRLLKDIYHSKELQI